VRSLFQGSILSCAMSCCAFAADAPERGVADAVAELRKISVTATRGEREIDSVAGAVTVIDAEQIRRQLATDIKDLIRYEPGISVADSPGRFGLSGFNIRGIEGNRVLIRIDGVRMADAFSIGSFSDARRNLIDLEAIKQVEIIRGAASALYGSDALGGVVSFVMREPQDFLTDGRGADFGVRSGYQSTDDGWYSGGRLAFGGETLAALVMYTHRAGGESSNQGNIDAPDRTRTEPNPQDYVSDTVLTKLSWNPTADQQLRLTLQADRNNVDTNVLSSVGVAGTANTQSLRGDDTQRRRRVSLSHDIAADNAVFDSLQWQVYAQESTIEQRTAEQRFATTAGPASAVRRDRVFDFEQRAAGGELVLRKDFPLAGSEHTLTYGLDAVETRTEQTRDGVQTALATGARTGNIPPDNFPVRDFPQTRTRQYALFAQDEISLGAWRLVPGVRVDRYELDPRPDAVFVEDNPGVRVDPVEETSVSPKLGVIHFFTDDVSMFAQYAHGFRAPPYNDVNIGFTNLAFGYTAVSNPDLQAETSDGYEVGVRGDFERGFVELSGFYSEYDDFIESLADAGVRDGLQVFQSRNIAEARIHGIEVRGGADLAALSLYLSGWSVKASAAWARGTNRVTDQPLNSVDPLKGVLGLAYAPVGQRWGAELVATAVKRKSRVDQGAGALFIPDGYVTLDLLAYADIGERLRINAGVFNLADKKCWEWADVRGRSASDGTIDRFTRPGLNASVSASMRF
jgi:hemoglobin/transferrin/lactoferrin receptor protein